MFCHYYLLSSLVVAVVVAVVVPMQEDSLEQVSTISTKGLLLADKSRRRSVDWARSFDWARSDLSKGLLLPADNSRSRAVVDVVVDVMTCR